MMNLDSVAYSEIYKSRLENIKTLFDEWCNNFFEEILSVQPMTLSEKEFDAKTKEIAEHIKRYNTEYK